MRTGPVRRSESMRLPAKRKSKEDVFQGTIQVRHTGGEIAHVKHLLPKSLRELWPSRDDP